MTTTNYTAKQWVHPTTGEVRIYINSSFLGDQKLYFKVDEKMELTPVVTGTWVKYEYRGINGAFKLAGLVCSTKEDQQLYTECLDLVKQKAGL